MMGKLRRLLCKLCVDRQGVSSLEYAMIAVATTVAIAGVLPDVFSKLVTMFATLAPLG